MYVGMRTLITRSTCCVHSYPPSFTPLGQVCMRYHNCSGSAFPPGFTFWPTYFSIAEQRTLLAASLYKLDMLETRHMRRRRNIFWNSKLGRENHLEVDPLQELFAPDSLYEFQEVSHAQNLSTFPYKLLCHAGTL